MRRNKFVWSAVLLVGCIVVIGAMANTASATLLVYEPFAYADGWLKADGSGGALGTTGTWNADCTINGDWRIHQEGDTTGVVVAPGPPIERNMFDGTVANLITSGGYVGVPGPLDMNPPKGVDEDAEVGRNQSADIGIASSVTETFQSGTTTWISYVSVRGWDRNEEHANLVLGTIPAPNQSRGDNYGGIGTGGSGFGTGGGPTRNNRTDIYPMFYDAGQYSNATGDIAGNSYGDGAHEVPQADAMDWVEYDADGFGAANIVVMKLEWDADDTKDIISVARFLETDAISEAAFDAMIIAQPNLSSANWAVENKASLDQSQLDTLTFMGLKILVDEIRVATTFDEAVPVVPEPGTFVLLAVAGLLLLVRRRR